MDNNDNYQYCNLIHVLNSGNLPTDWVPVIMCYYKRFKDENLVEFTKLVACKAIADMICGESPTKRIENMNKIMPVVECSSNTLDILSNSQIFSFDKDLFMHNVQSDIYGKTFAKTLLLLLEYMYQDNSILHTFNMVSIEHILPQKPSANSQWNKDFTEDERINNVHKIGNLCIIGRRKNTSLSNLDYQEKRKKYFERNIGNFARTLSIYHRYPDLWTLAELQENTNIALYDIKKMFNVV